MNHTAAKPFTSKLGNDPAMAALVDLYLKELPIKAGRLETALAAGDFRAVAGCAHQLARAAFYGFPQLATCARSVERIATDDPGSTDLTRQTRVLLDLCRAARTSS